MKPRSTTLPSFTTLTALSALAALLSLTSLPAQAIGRLADVTIVDRDTGATLPVYRAKGEYWVAGRPGARYAITVRNRLGERVLAVPSVDGVNVLSGETAAWDQRGYVFSPYERYEITGWRKSSSEVAAFEFSSIGNAYATRTGRPGHVGVIGVALFREQPPPAPLPSVVPEPSSPRRDQSDERAESVGANKQLERLREEPAPSPAPAPSAPRAAAAESSARAQSADTVAKPAPLPAPKLGTAHGQRETSVVTHTTFTRLQSQPNEIISIRYDSHANLVAQGVIRESVARPPVPRPFPQSDNFSYVPDPR